MTGNNNDKKAELSDAQLAQRRAAGRAGKGVKKKGYTLTDKALAQRQAAAEHSTGPVTDEGKAASSRNAWKHGLYSQAQGLIKEHWSVGAFAKPCRTTCQYHPENAQQAPAHPCTLVLDGYTQAGGDCLDKTVYVQAFDRLLDVLHDGKADRMYEVLAAEAAGALELLQRLRQEIAENGFIINVPLVSKAGEPIMLPVYDDAGNKVNEKPVTKPVGNPIMPHYYKMLDALGINLPELLATPRAVKDIQNQGDEQNAIATLLGQALGAAAGGVRRGKTYEG